MNGRVSEDDFVNEGLSGEELESAANMNADPEPAPAPEPEPGAPEAAKQEPAPEPAEPKMVDIRALQEARAAERAIKEEFTRKQEEYARLEERTNLILKSFEEQRRAQEEAGKPTRDDDPLGFIDSRFEEVTEKLKRFEEAEQARIEAADAAHQRQEVLNTAGTVFNNAATRHTDIQEALQYSLDQTKAELVKRGLSGQALQQALDDNLVHYAANAPQDPDEMAEYVRRNARYWGWTATPAAAGGAQASVAQMAERQERHASLSGTQGGEAPKGLDAKTLGAMSDKEFQQLMSTASGRKQVDSIMGA